MEERMKRQICAATVAACLVTVTLVIGQTKITAPKNKYTPAQDVQLGREAAAEVQKQVPLLNDQTTEDYIERLGARLVENIPAEFRHSEFRYTFDAVNLREINAFALPGGPMFAYRGMIEKAGTEGEIAGVLAHEISHVALRHGTAQASKAQKYQIGQVGSAILGAIIGGRTGSVVSQVGQFGFGAAFLRFSREYEKQADLLGAQIMARAGYDPRALAHMFETIEQQSRSSGGGGPQWMSSHPNPGNRTQYINQEAALLTVASAADVSEFESIKTAFASLPPAGATSDVGRAQGPAKSVGTPGQPVPRPSSQYKNISGGLFQAAVPSEWTSVQEGKSAIKIVPQNGYGSFE